MNLLNRRVLIHVRVSRATSWLPRSVSFEKHCRVRGAASMVTRDELRGVALRYVPRSMSATDWAQVRDFTQSVTVEHVLPTEPDRATLRLTMLAVAQAAHVTLHQVGGELTYTDVFDPLVVEYVVSQTGLTDRAKGVRRSLLYRLGRELNPNWPFDDRTTKYGYKAPDAPYTEQEQHFLTQWAQGLSTDYQRAGATLTLALGLGAGLRAGEMARLRGGDVTVHADGCVTLTAHGYRNTAPREVPVLAEWEQIVGEAAASAGTNGLVLWPNRAHATTESVAAIVSRIGKPHAVSLDTRRLRTTWIVGHMRGLVPEPVICQAAGLTDLQHFAKWHETAEIPAGRARALLRRSPYPDLRVAN
ncbi:tyrosine recombinase XerC [Corynebacterium diphtheriae]|nr:tyrosine recombinase XerC [Corynebacterium diphtheriae]CAB0931406.1 tyrosine recombinase XerC [Corynebacterium diphtheriae]